MIKPNFTRVFWRNIIFAWIVFCLHQWPNTLIDAIDFSSGNNEKMPTLDILFEQDKKQAGERMAPANLTDVSSDHGNGNDLHNINWSGIDYGNVLDIGWDPQPPKTGDSQKDLVQPNETHLEGVPYFIQHPKPLYYTMKGRPATIECIAEPVSHAIIECAEKVIPYKGPDESGRLKVTRLNSNNQPDPNGKRWKLELQVRAREVEEWFDSYVCRCEAWNKVVELQRPKKVVSRETAIVEAYMDRKFQLEPVSTELIVGKRLVLTCIPPKGKPDPEVYWLKDGKRVNKESFPHVLLNDYNHLIIENTSLSDGGNYTCVAECLGVEYRYATAIVVVQHETTSSVPLHQWSAWSSCSWTSESVKPGMTIVRVCEQKRQRACIAQTTPHGNSAHEAQQASSDGHLQLNPSNCPQPTEQSRNCSVVECNETSVPSSKSSQFRENSPSVTDAIHPVYAHEIAIYCAIFVLLIILLFMVIFFAIRRRAPYALPNCWFCFDCCLPGKKLYVTEMRGIPTKDNCNTNRCKQPNLSKQQPSFESRPLIYDAVPVNEPTAQMSPAHDANDSCYSMTQYDNPQFLLSNYHIPKSQVLMRNLNDQHFMSRNVRQHLHMFPSTNVGTEITVMPTPALKPLVMSNILIANQNPDDTSKPSTVQSNFNSSEQSSGYTVTTTGLGSGNTGSSDGSVRAGSTVDARYLAPTNFIDPVTRDIASYDLPQSPSQYIPLADRMEKNSQSDEFATKTIDGNGGVIRLRNACITMRIPMNTLNNDGEKMIFLGLCTDDRQRPQLSENQTILSPIVYFGPHGRLSNPVILTIPHCADMNGGAWTIRLLCSHGMQNGVCENDQNVLQDVASDYVHGNEATFVENNWKEMIVVCGDTRGYERIMVSMGVSCFILDTQAQIITRFPGRYCLIGESKIADTAVRLNGMITYGEETQTRHRLARKSLMLAAFASLTTPVTMDYSIRIYVLPATPDALEYVKKLEKQLDGQLFDRTNKLAFVDDGSPLCFVIDEISSGWRSRLPNRTQEIPHRHIWNGTQTSTLHCAFNLEKVDFYHNYVSCEITVFQGSNPDNFQKLQISSADRNESKTFNSSVPRTPEQLFRLSHEVKRKISETVDNALGWQTLAELMSFHFLVSELSTARNPTIILLELWEANCENEEDFTKLENILNEAGYPNCAMYLGAELESPVSET